jgi:hypothetical protein
MLNAIKAIEGRSRKMHFSQKAHHLAKYQTMSVAVMIYHSEKYYVFFLASCPERN